MAEIVVDHPFAGSRPRDCLACHAPAGDHQDSLPGTCPDCDGSTRRPVPPESQRWKTSCWGYDPDTDTFACNNCGGQTMSGRASGTVPYRADGRPCHHEYDVRSGGRCLAVYDCRHCGHHYEIDSGD